MTRMGVAEGEDLRSLVLVSGKAVERSPASAGLPVEPSSRQVGQIGEDEAARFLEEEGYEILERNWRCCSGEVDLIARGSEEGQAVLVEVKARRMRRADAHVAPELAVGPRKRARYRTMALMYLSLHPELSSVRFDVIGVGLSDTGESKVRHLEGAYGWDDNL